MAQDQRLAPMLDQLAAARVEHRHGFGAPGHHLGVATSRPIRGALGRGPFRADLATPKGLDDRMETRQTVQSAHAIGAEAWCADWCRYTSSGSTQSLHILLASLTRAGDAILVVRNAHKAVASYAVAAGLEVIDLDVVIDDHWDIEHTPTPVMLAAALARSPRVKAVIVVSPTYFGVTADVAALAAAAHERGVPLIVDAAWGAALGFSEALPANPLTQGADAMVVSVHKTLGALGGGSALLARDTGRLDLERLALAYELLLTTSPSVPILASVDDSRREAALHGGRRWADAVATADRLRDGLAGIDGVRVFGRERVGAPGLADLDATKVTFDLSALGVSGYAADDWLVAQRQVSIGSSDAARLVAIVSPGTTRRDVRALIGGITALAAAVRADAEALAATPRDLPRLAALTRTMAMIPAAAFHGPAEHVDWSAAEGRIAAEIIAPAPPGIARLIPGQRIEAAHVHWLIGQRDAGMFVLDPADAQQRQLRVVA